ncbi:phenazine biosynthesis protein [Sphingobacteriaceae bacterium]|nr:phenazine biosynthesis protein [Sphingobacteriaceae bacterium]
MKKIPITIVNAFSIDNLGGNPAAIVFDADHYTIAQKQEIATKINVSETAFVSSSAIADYKLEFFTPSKQIAHCGHATIATFSYMKQTGAIKKKFVVKETIDGLREIRFVSNKAFMEQKAPFFSRPNRKDLGKILLSLNLTSSDIRPNTLPVIVNTGTSFLLIETADEIALKNAVPDHNLISELSTQYGLIGFYLFHRRSGLTEHATTRMFAPLYGIAEEAATGMAAGPLACLLNLSSSEQLSTYLIEQGRYMTPPSRSSIEVNLVVENGAIERLFVGGIAYLAETTTIDIR